MLVSCLLPELVQSKCFLLHVAAKARPLLERGWQEETMTAWNFFDPSPPPPFESCCPRSYRAATPLRFWVVLNSEPFAHGALGLRDLRGSMGHRCWSQEPLGRAPAPRPLRWWGRDRGCAGGAQLCQLRHI